MKLIDKVLRQWRVNVALGELPENVESVFDIGCDDGYLLKKFLAKNIRIDGCDPRLSIDGISLNSTLLKGFFPEVLNNSNLKNQYDVIFALAVFEHFTEDHLTESAKKISEILTDHGCLIVTVPHPFVDKILDFLMFFKLIDGQALEEHHGFNPDSLVDVLSRELRLKTKKKFQLGLNNMFVFEKNNR
jgi:trans-aconitate methyltransferase